MSPIEAGFTFQVRLACAYDTRLARFSLANQFFFFSSIVIIRRIFFQWMVPSDIYKTVFSMPVHQ